MITVGWFDGKISKAVVKSGPACGGEGDKIGKVLKAEDNGADRQKSTTAVSDCDREVLQLFDEQVKVADDSSSKSRQQMEEVKVIDNVKQIQQKDEFRPKLVASDPGILGSMKIAEEDMVKEVKHFSEEISSRILGSKVVANDSFDTTVGISTRESVASEDMYSVLALMFSALGSVLPCVVVGCMFLFQDMTRIMIRNYISRGIT